MNRKLLEQVITDLEKKMVIITGPRQAGKTWLSKEVSRSFKSSLYLNYDRSEDREIIKKESWLEDIDLLILDEIHKMPKWKNYLKGIYDTKPESLKILVTGSARLETFKDFGDSMAGRFYRHRLLPFTPSELKVQNIEKQDMISLLFERGGFPEPFLSKKDSDHLRWRRQYIDGLIREDILDFENILNIRSIQLLLELLRKRVGSPLSYKSLSEDLQVSPNTVKKYIQILEALFIIFLITPFSKNIARSLLKEPKLYFFDIGMIQGDKGIVWENLVALSLLKEVYGKEDQEGTRGRLQYLRNKEGKEVDFCIVENEEIKESIEVKTSDKKVSSNLKYFHKKYGFRSIQLVLNLKRERKDEGIEIRDGFKFLENLNY